MVIFLVDLRSLQRDILCFHAEYWGSKGVFCGRCSVSIRYVRKMQNKAWFFCFVL